MSSQVNNQTQEPQKPQVNLSETMFSELMGAPGLESLLVHPAFRKYQEYLSKLRAFYAAIMIYNSPTERHDCEYKGRIRELDELIGLPEIIKDRLKTKSEVV